MEQVPTNAVANGVRTRGDSFTMPFCGGELVAGKYEIIELIGAGAVGYVVSARRIDLGDKVAIKFLRPELLAYEDVVGRFTQEARTAVMIHSQHVVRVFDVGSLPKAGPFIAMEFLEGSDLGRVIDEKGPLPVTLAVEYILQACEALATAHASGVIHRDVKPENLFLTRSLQGNDVVKVLDFGISKVLLDETTCERTPYITTMSTVGSPMYMAPEQVRASEGLDPRADIWGLGCVLYELLTGAPAFDAASLTELASKILERDPAPMRSRRADVSPALEAVVSRCLHKDRDRRFGNIGELALQLCPFASERALVWAQRCCHVLRGARPQPTASPAQDDTESFESSPASLSPAAYDVTAARAGDVAAVDVGLSATRSRELAYGGRPGAGPLAIWLGLGAIAMAGVLWTARPASSIGTAGATTLVLVGGAASPVAAETASVPVPASSGAAAARSSTEVAPNAPAAAPRDARLYRAPTRAPLRPRPTTPASLEATARARELTEPASPLAKPDIKNRAPLVGDDSRVELVE